MITLILLVPQTSIFAHSADAEIIDRDGAFRFSPPLYEARRVLEHDLSGLEDIFIDEYDYIFVARTGDFDAEVVIFNSNEEFIKTVGNDDLRSASGVFVRNTDEGRLIYVVDRIARLIYVFDEFGEVLQTIGRPTSPLFGTTAPFEPRKIAVDRVGNLYIISEGSINGIINLDAEGEFIGYFAAGTTDANWLRRLQRNLFSEEMMANFIRNTPTSMSHIAIDSRGIVYATTRGETNEALKKINIAGVNLFDNIFPVDFYEAGFVNLGDVTTCINGFIYTYSETTGRIYILDEEGRILGSFGKSSTLPSELGITTSPVGIAVNSNHTIYIADRGDGWVLIFEPTPLMERIFSGVTYYNAGLFIEGEDVWREVLSRNSAIAMAHDALGMSRLIQNDYEGALVYFRLSNNRGLYSNAFWQLRQSLIINYAAPVLLGLIAIGMTKKILARIDKATNFLAGFRSLKKRMSAFRLVSEISQLFKVIKYPNDAFYEILAHGKISVITSSILYVLTVLILVSGAYFNGFIFNEINTYSVRFFSPIQQSVNYFIVGVLFVISNFLITSIKDGRGNFVHIYKGTAVALLPLIILYTVRMIMSNLLTNQEVFLLNLLSFVMIVWTIVLIIIMVIEIHQYETKEALITLLLTVFTMIVLFVVIVVIYMLSTQMLSFFRTLFQEVLGYG